VRSGVKEKTRKNIIILFFLEYSFYVRIHKKKYNAKNLRILVKKILICFNFVFFSLRFALFSLRFASLCKIETLNFVSILKKKFALFASLRFIGRFASLRFLGEKIFRFRFAFSIRFWAKFICLL